MTMTSNNFISLSSMPKNHASGAAAIDASTTNTTHDDHHGSDNNGHNHSSTNHDEDDNAMHQHDHSSHSMSTMSQGTVMYMDGFQSALFHNSQTPPPCLNFLHPTWTLHTQSKFIFAMLCVTLMGMLVEACGVWRVRCLRKGRTHRREQRLKRIRLWERAQRQLQQQQVPNMQGQEFQYRRRMQREVSELSNVSSDNGEDERLMIVEEEEYDDGCPRPIRRIWRIVPSCIRNVCDKHVSGLDKQGNPKWIKIYDFGAASLHAVRAWLGYLLMLAVMTYAVEFLFSAVFGMVFGRYWFVDMDARADGGGVLGGAVGVGGAIGGAGLGEGGRQPSSEGVAMNDNDGTWGGGGDPCCGIDEGDEDNNVEPLREPLLGSNTGVSRRPPSTAFV